MNISIDTATNAITISESTPFGELQKLAELAAAVFGCAVEDVCIECEKAHAFPIPGTSPFFVPGTGAPFTWPPQITCYAVTIPPNADVA